MGITVTINIEKELDILESVSSDVIGFAYHNRAKDMTLEEFDLGISNIKQ